MKKWISLLLVTVISFISITAFPHSAHAEEEYKPMLVLVQTASEKWTAYENLTCIPTKATSTYLKAETLCKILGFSCKRSSNTFTISNGKKKLTYTLNSKKYKYYDGKTTVTRTSYSNAYITDDAFGDVSLVECQTMRDLIYYRHFTEHINFTDFKKYGMVLCFSKIKWPKALPNTSSIYDTNKKPWTAYNKYPIVQIEPVDFPKLSSFAKGPLTDPDGLWGSDVTGNTPFEDALNTYNKALLNTVLESSMEGPSCDYAGIKVSDNAIIAEVNANATIVTLRLYKEVDHYEIYISSSLARPSTGYIDYSEVLKSILHLYCKAISSTPDQLYDAIYTTWQKGSSVISKASWTTVGDAKVKFRIDNKNAGVFSVKAK